jgi:hypothetical protein
MDPKTELLERLSIALTEGQGDFTEADLALAFKEVKKMLVQGQIGNLIIEGRVKLRISDGTVLYSAAKGEEGPSEAMPLETLIDNVRDAEDQ